MKSSDLIIRESAHNLARCSVKVLLIHNFYLQPGGEDQVFLRRDRCPASKRRRGRRIPCTTIALLPLGRLALARSTVWNRAVFRDLTGPSLQDYAPDLVHCHNTFPLVSPVVYAAARRFQIPVVQTLHIFGFSASMGCFSGMANAVKTVWAVQWAGLASSTPAIGGVVQPVQW